MYVKQQSSKGNVADRGLNDLIKSISNDKTTLRDLAITIVNFILVLLAYQRLDINVTVIFYYTQL